MRPDTRRKISPVLTRAPAAPACTDAGDAPPPSGRAPAASTGGGQPALQPRPHSACAPAACPRAPGAVPPAPLESGSPVARAPAHCGQLLPPSLFEEVCRDPRRSAGMMKRCADGACGHAIMRDARERAGAIEFVARGCVGVPSCSCCRCRWSPQKPGGPVRFRDLRTWRW
jgi:hypothetical protein